MNFVSYSWCKVHFEIMNYMNPFIFLLGTFSSCCNLCISWSWILIPRTWALCWSRNSILGWRSWWMWLTLFYWNIWASHLYMNPCVNQFWNLCYLSFLPQLSSPALNDKSSYLRHPKVKGQNHQNLLWSKLQLKLAMGTATSSWLIKYMIILILLILPIFVIRKRKKFVGKKNSLQ